MMKTSEGGVFVVAKRSSTTLWSLINLRCNDMLPMFFVDLLHCSIGL